MKSDEAIHSKATTLVKLRQLTNMWLQPYALYDFFASWQRETNDTLKIVPQFI